MKKEIEKILDRYATNCDRNIKSAVLTENKDQKIHRFDQTPLPTYKVK